MSAWTNATAAPRAVGILRPELTDTVVRRQRLEPSDALTTWIEHYWSVAWDLGEGGSFVSEVVSHPSVHATVESGTHPRFGYSMPVGLVHGVVTHRFSHVLTGSGRVFGVKFRPGGFGAFTGAHVGDWSDRVIPLVAALGGEARELTTAVLAEPLDIGRSHVADAFLCERLPAPDQRYAAVLAVIADIREDPSLTTVAMAARRHHVSERTLQRLFGRYVGVGPKWVMQRARLHDAVDRIDTGRYDDFALLAVELGWFDQAHFTRDFTAYVGQSPASYAARRRG